MPSNSEPMRRLMGAALAAKRGARPTSKKAAKLARSMSEGQLNDYAKKPTRGHKSNSRRSRRK